MTPVVSRLEPEEKLVVWPYIEDSSTSRIEPKKIGAQYFS